MGHNRIDGCDERATYIFVIKGTNCWPPKQGQQVKVIYSMGLGIFALALYSAFFHPTSIPPGTRKVYAVYYCYNLEKIIDSTIVSLKKVLLYKKCYNSYV